MPPDVGSLAQIILAAPDVDRLNQDLQAGLTWRKAYESASTVFTDTALQSPPPSTRASLLAGTTSFFARWGRAYRRASRELAALLKEPIPKTAAKRVALVDQLTQLAVLRREWEDDHDYCSRVLGDEWRGERTDFPRLQAIAH
jgi:hypothetical protein